MNKATARNGREPFGPAVRRVLALAPEVGGGALCSRDGAAVRVRARTRDLLDGGAVRWLLPIAPRSRTRFVAYLADLRADAPTHGTAALRAVVAGSVRHGGRTLTAGDWLWEPAGTAPATAGPDGALLFTALPEPAGPRAPDPRDDGPARVDGRWTALASRFDGRLTSRTPGADEAVRDLADIADHRFLPFTGRARLVLWQLLVEPHAPLPDADWAVVTGGALDSADGTLTAGDWLWTPGGVPRDANPRATGAGALLLAGRFED
ncbi:hypothetical protein [Actinomadura atramentaria]|uniref:hypothetical protein n=1 Tax=Actinomadura atramentaria TaxID=1990 RepID=UPI00036BEFCD|nr:hypothetical protein [Actinomadura atramentaria]